MIAPMYEIVLVAVMAINIPYGLPQVEYQPIEYYNSLAKCNREQKKLSQNKDKKIAYICVKVDRE